MRSHIVAPDHLRTPLDYLRQWERDRPDAIYLSQPQANGTVHHYTWRNVSDQARRMANYIVSLNLPQGSSIAILGKNSAHWIMVDIAIWMSGHVSVPIYATSSADVINYVLEHSEAKMLLIGRMDELWADVEEALIFGGPRITLPMGPNIAAPHWEDIVATSNPLVAYSLPSGRSLATIIYTSGSTGHPKGVMIDFEAMMSWRQAGDIFGINSQDRMISYLPLAHAFERALVETVSIIFGVHVFFTYSIDTFKTDLQRARPTLFVSVPRLWVKFYQGVCEKMSPVKQRWLFGVPLVARYVKRKILNQLGLDQVRVAWTGSAPLSPALISWYRTLGLELLEGYAMTENFANSHTSLPGRARVGYVGHPNPGVEQRINPMNGEIEIKSPGLMLGYYKDDIQTKSAFTADGFLKTGDMGEIDDEGRLKITGRIKELFKTAKGKYVAPQPIEKRLAELPHVGMVCVAGLGLPQPVAMISLSEEALLALGSGALQRTALVADFELRLADINLQLEEHEKIQCLALITESWSIQSGVLTPTMKVKRSKVESRYSPRFEEWLAAGRPIVWVE